MLGARLGLLGVKRDRVALEHSRPNQAETERQGCATEQAKPSASISEPRPSRGPELLGLLGSVAGLVLHQGIVFILDGELPLFAVEGVVDSFLITVWFR